MINSRLINTKVAGGGCTDIVDNFDPFGGNGVALYQLNGNANDVSENYDGNFVNPAYGTGVFGQAGVFNGSSSYIAAPNNSLLTQTEYTASAWVNSNSMGTAYRTIISNYGYTSAQGESGWIFMLYLNKVRVFNVVSGASYFVESIASIPLGIWTNIVVTNTQSIVNIYINGSFDSTHSMSGFQFNLAVTNYFTIGNYRFEAGSLGGTFNGSLDQVRLFNTALDPLEIEALYTEELCICDGTVDTLDILGDGSCIATYQLDGNANDLSGNYSGTPTNVSYGVGEFDLAGVFNGSSSYILANGLQSLYDNNQTSSISFWFKTTTASAEEDYMFIDYSGYLNYGIAIKNSKIFVLTRVPSAADVSFTSTLSYNDGNWHNIVVSKNNSTLQRTIYVDNQLLATQSISGNSFTATPQVSIGCLYVGSVLNAFNGSIDQVRIFNKALNSTEVTTLYNESACTKVTRTAGATQILGDSSCVAYYKLDGDVTDETNTYNGTVVGTISYADGEFDYAADFDYSNNYINTNCPLLWDNVQGNITPITISCWIKGQGYSGTGSGWIAMAGYFAYIRKTPNNEIVIQTLSNTGGSLNLITSSAILNNTDWFHIVGVWNFKTIKLYINNQFIGEDTGTAGFSGDQQITKNILIGKWNLTSQNQGYLGEIDQFRVFNKEVSASEVTTLYNEGI